MLALQRAAGNRAVVRVLARKTVYLTFDDGPRKETTRSRSMPSTRQA